MGSHHFHQHPPELSAHFSHSQRDARLPEHAATLALGCIGCQHHPVGWDEFCHGLREYGRGRNSAYSLRCAIRQTGRLAPRQDITGEAGADAVSLPGLSSARQHGARTTHYYAGKSDL